MSGEKAMLDYERAMADCQVTPFTVLAEQGSNVDGYVPVKAMRALERRWNKDRRWKSAALRLVSAAGWKAKCDPNCGCSICEALRDIYKLQLEGEGE